MPLISLISDIIKEVLYHPLLLLCLSDSDFTSDKITSKLTYDDLFIIAGGPVNEKS